MCRIKQFLNVVMYAFVVLPVFLSPSLLFCHSIEAKEINQRVSRSRDIARKHQSRAISTAIRDINQDPDTRKRIAAARLLGYHAVPEGIAALGSVLVNDKDARVRDKAASSLWKLGKKALAVQKQLTLALEDSDPGVRVRASWALQVQGINIRDLAQTRRSVLVDEKSDVTERFWAARGLVDLDPPTSLIQPILEYSKGHIRSKPAKKALKKIVARQDRTIVEPMRAMVADFHPGNGLIVEAMEGFHPKIVNMVQLICQQLSYDNDELIQVALSLLEKHTETAEEVLYWLPLVKHYTANYTYALRLAAVRLIGRAGGLAKDALPELVQVIRFDEKPLMRQKAIEAIGKIGDKNQAYSVEHKNEVAAATVKELIRVIEKDSDQKTRISALRNLDKLQTRATQVIPVFVYAALNDNSSLARMSALQALARLGKKAQLATSSIRTLLDHPDKATRQNAIWALKSIKTGNPQVTRVLQSSSDKKNSGQRQQAMTALRKENSSCDERGLMQALISADVGKVKKYLDSGVSADYRFGSMHEQPMLSMIFVRTLMYARHNKPTPTKIKDVTKLLLERGAVPNAIDKKGNTPLMKAAMGCDEELLQMLLDAGADPHIISKDGLTALEYGLSFANKGITAMIKAGSKLSADKVIFYRKTHAGNSAILALIDQASAN